MKAKAAPTKDQIERVEQKVWQNCLDSMSDNLAVTLIVLNQKFGFGEKRIRQFLDGVSEITEEVNAYNDDYIMREKLDEGLKSFGLSHDEIYFTENMSLYLHQKKVREEKSKASIKESIEMKKQLEAMQALLRGDIDVH